MYIPLFNKSNYSLLSSLLKIDDIVKYAIDNNISSIALTDTNMYGVMEFIKKCESNNIKPIIGLNIVLEDINYVVIAKDYKGYKDLLKISTIINTSKLEEKDIKKYNNLICLIPFKYLNKYDDYKKIYKDIYLGYSNKQEEKEALIITKDIVFLRESLYLNKTDQDTLPYLYRIRDGKTILDEEDYDIENHELNINNLLDLTDNNGLINTLKIAESVNIEFPNKELLLPIYDVKDPKKYLFELCKKGLSKRLNGEIPDNYKERLVYE